MKQSVKISVLALMAGVAFSVPAYALSGNVLVNGNFEAETMPNWGNNIQPTNNGQPTGWKFGIGSRANIVKVDGPGGQAVWYGSSGPQSDANTASGAGVTQHYLDIANGNNNFYQTFTPKCTGKVVFGGAFSSRANSKGTGSIAIRKGDGLNGQVIGQTNQVTIPRGNSMKDAWENVNYSTNVQAGQAYSFVVAMDDNMNFDEAYVKFETRCDQYGDSTGGFGKPDVILGSGTDYALDGIVLTAATPTSPKLPSCCPPWNKTMLSESLKYQATGNITDPYTLRYNPASSVNTQMEAYINYLNALDPSVNAIIVNFRLFDKGQNPTSPGLGTQVGSEHFVEWSAGGSSAPSNGGGNFFNLPSQGMKINNWYRVQTGVYLAEGKEAFDKDCANNDMMINIQVQSKNTANGGSPNVMLKTMQNGRITTRKVSVKKQSRSDLKKLKKLERKIQRR